VTGLLQIGRERFVIQVGPDGLTARQGDDSEADASDSHKPTSIEHGEPSACCKRGAGQLLAQAQASSGWGSSSGRDLLMVDGGAELGVVSLGSIE